MGTSSEYYLKMKEQEFMELFGDMDTSTLSYQQGNYIERLLNNSAIPEQREREIYRALHSESFSYEEAIECIDYLQQNQRDDIAGGFTYQAKDILRKLNKLK